MSDMYFKSLPDKSTPLIPENLDKLNDIKVSPTEPTTNEKVWIQKGKNLIKNFTPGLFYNYINKVFETGTSFSTSIFINVTVGKTYVFSHALNSVGGAIACFDDNGNFLEILNQDAILTPFTITNINCKKILCMSWDAGGNPAVNETWMQLEEGSTPTEYEEYIEKAIHTRNDNGVYEEVYKESDFNIEGRKIWSGNLYTTGLDNTQTTSEAFKTNKLYMFVVQGLSGSFRMTIPYIHGTGNSLQYAYYDGTTVIRWRIIINSTATGFYLSTDSLNMASNTGVLAVYRID